jgi:hypothetical protein
MVIRIFINPLFCHVTIPIHNNLWSICAFTPDWFFDLVHWTFFLRFVTNGRTDSEVNDVAR